MNDLVRIRKRQLHSHDLKSWNYRGEIVSGDFSPRKVLSGDNWFSGADSPVMVNDVVIHPGDMVLALTDAPGELTAQAIRERRWKHIGGEKLRMRTEFFIDAGDQGNYDVNSSWLTIAGFSATPFLADDNVNLYLNGAKYTLEHFTFAPGANVIVWIPLNVGFDLETGDFVEIEVFNR
jgi:hypothetical protein